MDPRSQQPASRGSTPVPTRDAAGVHVPLRDKHREAAADILRGELDAIYAGNSDQNTPHTTPVVSADTSQQTKAQAGQAMASADNSTDPYDKTHGSPSLAQADEWKKYHSAWQQYYQKYYEQYYVSAVKQKLSNNFSDTSSSDEPNTTTKPDDDGVLTRDEALYELRQNIINQASSRAHKVRRSRHFIPIAAALSVVIVFALLQYNQVLIANVKAYVSPSAIEPQNIIVDPNADVPVGSDTKMIIPKINVDAPIVMNVGPSNTEQLEAMSNGIAHVRYPGASSVPGEVGNSVFSAHSSSDWTDSGAYKFIFVQLERLAIDDVVYINYNSKRYTYKVYDIKVVAPTEINALNYTGTDPVITLITCTPLGTAQKRLLVFAKQVSPDPAGATKPAETQAPANTTTEITGTSPTLLERLFGAQ
ncbi:sortase [Candidatus Mycosynbacter amalyticus]|uniref:Sortase n=1 Tax=Candidatus Mycosynbacter amalyticus TaxID=2665156 RepID=A0A857MKM6_9BACT|nr:sortase [Candidatus Mycosynbacter amalyticus]QHN42688.1 sortase [Candidatus Mycosynbacter amalyticus]